MSNFKTFNINGTDVSIIASSVVYDDTSTVLGATNIQEAVQINSEIISNIKSTIVPLKNSVSVSVDLCRYYKRSCFVNYENGALKYYNNHNDTWGTAMFVPIKAGAVIVYSCNGWLDSPLANIAFFDINNNFLNGYNYNSETHSVNETITVTAEQDGYCCLSIPYNKTISGTVNNTYYNIITDSVGGSITEVAQKTIDNYIEIEQIKNNINVNDASLINNTITPLKGSTAATVDLRRYYRRSVFVNIDDGTIDLQHAGTETAWGTALFIPVKAGAIIKYYCNGWLDQIYSNITLYDTDKNFLSSLTPTTKTHSVNETITVTAEQDGYCCYAMPYSQVMSDPINSNYSIVTDSDEGSITEVAQKTIDNYIEIEQTKDIITELESVINSTDITTLVTSDAFKGFYKFGLIGASYTTGHMHSPITDTTSRNLRFSWGQILARKNGQVCLNFGVSGATATTFFTNPALMYNKLILEENLCQCYILTMGGNMDAGGLGTVDDIDWDNSDNNAATFYGQYARIVQTIRGIAPYAIIFCINQYYPRTSSLVSTAIETIATDEHVSSNTFFVDMTPYNDIIKNYIIGPNQLSTSNLSEFDKFYYDWHPTAAGYAMLARIVEYAISQVIIENAHTDAILSIGQIPYGSNESYIE